MNRQLTSIAFALVLAGLVGQASSTRYWQVASQADLLKGDVEQLSIDEFGRLVLGPSMRSVYDAVVPFVWTLASGPDGSLYAGTGNDGQVIRIDPQGKASVWFDAGELEVHAMAVAMDGSVYAGTSPDGRVYRIDAAGKSTVVFDPEDKYIWSLAIDAQGRLYVGTGEKGQIYRVAPGGAATPFYKASATHVTALAIDGQGRLLAGTESPGRLLRFDASGRPFVLVDSPYREIRAIRVARDGRIYAAAVNGKPAQDTAPAPVSTPAPTVASAPSASVSAEIVTVTVLDAPQISVGGSTTAAPSTTTTPTAKGAVYRIDNDGAAEIVWESKDDIPFDVLPDGPDGVLVSTGNGGKVFSVAGSPLRATLVTRVAGQQATALLATASARYVATSNPGRIVALGAKTAAEGTWVSDVRDAGTTATWGTLSWRTGDTRGGRVQVFTRSGNTATPDDAWSPWAGPYERAEGEGVRSPAARYLQWKVTLAAGTGPDAAPSLASMSIAYLQRNQRPRVTDITVHPPGVVFQRPYPTGDPEIAGLDNTLPEFRFPVFSMPLGTPVTRGSAPALGRRLYQKGLQAFAWRAEDPNDDRLVYDLHVRRVGDTSWKPLRSATLDELVAWDTTSVADGTYVLRVTASDRLANPSAAALAGELVSTTFDVDNTPPVIGPVAIKPDGTRSVVTFEVSDTQSVVDRLEYSVDLGPWQTVYPTDGAADSRKERFEVVIEGAAAGRVTLRATDAMNNTGTARVEAPVARATK
jgi:hypothetical protein